MQVFNSLRTVSDSVVTMGNYDGVHLAHQAILNRVKSYSTPDKKSVVITFSNHPKTVLRPDAKLEWICTQEQRLLLFEKQGVDIVFSIPFTKEFASQEAELFIKSLQKQLGMTHFILGYNAVFGKGREGTPEKLLPIAKELNLLLEYHPEISIEGAPISSTRIRSMIAEGDFEAVNTGLGRKYSILSTVIHGEGKGSRLGYPTANLALKELCLPPLGVYIVSLKYKDKLYQGIANLGFAPTLKQSETPLLEVHLFGENINLYKQEVEVFFHSFLRKEQLFKNAEQLRVQIQHDIQEAKSYFINTLSH